MPGESEFLKREKSIDETTTIERSQSVEDIRTGLPIQVMREAQEPLQDNQESLQEDFGFEVISADQIEEEPRQQNQPEVSVSFSVTGSVIREDDSSRMRDIKRSVAEYYRSMEVFGRIPATQENMQQKLAASEELVRKAGDIISNCKWYCFFRHPFTALGKKRKREVIALRDEVCQRLDSLRRQVNAIRFEKLENDNRNKRPEEGSNKISLIEKNRGRKLIDIGGKKMTYEPSDRERIRAKEFLADQVAMDRRNLGKRQDRRVRSLLSAIENYSAIHTTAMHFSTSDTNIDKTEGKEKARHQKKRAIRKQKLDYEIELVTTIKRELSALLTDEEISMEQKDVVRRYKSSFDAMTDGFLRDDPMAEHIDFSGRTRMLCTYAVKKEEKNQTGAYPIIFKTDVYETFDRSAEPLFPHEPCTQDIVQNQLGDCYFLAALSNYVADDPKAIRNIMKDNGSSVTVRFFRRNENKEMVPVYVKVPKISGDGTAVISLWVQMMENAYAAFTQTYTSESLRYELKDKAYRPKENELDFGFMGSGGRANIAFMHLTGHPIEDDLAIGKPSLIDFGRMIDDPFDMAFMVYKRSTESTGILMEREELDRSGAALEELEEKILLFNGAFKEGAKKEDKDKYLEITKNELRHIDKALNQKMYCFTGAYGETVVSFGAINERIKIFNDKYLKSLPDNIEELLLSYNKWKNEDGLKAQKAIDDRAEEIRRTKFPEVYDNFKTINSNICFEEKKEAFMKDNPGLYAQYMDYLKYLESDDQYLRLRRISREGVENYNETERMLTEHKALKYYGASNTDGKPGDTVRYRMQDKTEQARSISTDSSALLDFVADQLGISLSKNSKNSDNVKNNYEKMLAAIRRLNYEDIEDKLFFYHMNCVCYNAGNSQDAMKESRKEAFETVKMHATLMLETIIERFYDLLDEGQATIFSGRYSKETLEAYNRIESALADNKMICAGTRADKDIGTLGEDMTQGLLDGHEYTVLDVGEFDFEGRKIKMIKLRNPWAGYTVSYEVNTEGKVVTKSNYGKSNGEFWMELTHFAAGFRVIYLGSKVA